MVVAVVVVTTPNTNTNTHPHPHPHPNPLDQVYRRIRALFGVAERDYMLSLGPEQIMGERLLRT